MDTRKTTTPNFDSVARPYRFLEYLTLGPTLQRCRTHYLPHLLDRKQALILGDGDGRFTAHLLSVNLIIQVDAIDISATMLYLLRKRCEAASPTAQSRLRTHTQNALNFTPQQSPDLITAHFFFDCLTQSELDQLIYEYSQHTQPNTLWLVSDFRIPTGILQLPAKLYIRLLYLAFHLLTGLRPTHLPDYATPLRRAGLTRTHQHLSLFGLLSTELWTTSQNP
jgi:ubiquinone/menaquinone biosynthesis C-methylase UbiE